MPQRIETDYLVLGSGIAGLSFALKAARSGTVAVVTKKGLSESCTNHAQGGIASVLSPDDHFDLHVADTLMAGAGLCREDVVRLVVSDAPDRIRELIDLGTRFSRREDGTLSLGREGGHSRDRIVHAADLTGREVERTLVEAVAVEPGISIYDHHVAIDLTIETRDSSPRCRGASVLRAEAGRILEIRAKVVMLCTGGAGRVYLHTTNPDVATGDGIAMAYRAGAPIADMEFMQFHPTSLYHPDAESFLISEAVRGYGGILVNSRGEAFMDRDHPMKSLAPRDIVARSIDREMKRTGDACVYLDVTAKDADATRRRFPNIHQRCLDFGIDMTRRPIPVVPAAHYLCGGVVADEWGRTEIDGLYALGEVACTGLHGANRLASNSLLEALVFADRASRHAAMAVATAGLPEMLEPRPEREPSGSPVEADEEADRYRLEIRRLMWDCAGIVRRDEELRHAVSRIAETARAVDWLWSQAKKTPALIEARNLVEVAGLIIRSALARRESRGLHYNLDVPERDDRNWRRHTVLRNTD